MRAPEEVKKVLVRQWVAKAEQDLRASEALFAADPPLLYAACFHAQQAAEKYLKAQLTWLQVEFPKTHVIEQLLDLILRAGVAAASSLSEASELTPYGVDVRYPADQPEPTPEETRRAVELARKVQAAVSGALPLD
jgi:HEPN domain-containing protein